MSSLRFSNKAFVFALEALVAVILVVGFLSVSKVFPYEENYFSKIQTKQFSQDIAAFLDDNGFVLGVLDQNIPPSQQMSLIFSEFSSFMPSNTDFRIGLRQLDSNASTCILQKDFNHCFTDLNAFSPTGNDIPSDKDISHERFIFAKKQSPPQCLIIGGASFSPEKKLFENLIAYFSEVSSNDVLYFQSAPGDSNLFFGVKTTPSGTVSCDQTVRVDLNMGIIDTNIGREPIDMMFIGDKSLSMAHCAVADGNVIKQKSGSVQSGSFQLTETFSISGNSSFDVLMRFQTFCQKQNCPKIYIKSPTGQNYGYGFTSENTYVGTTACFNDRANYYENSSYDYIAIPSSISENGTWEIYAKSIDLVSYNLKEKTIAAPKAKIVAMREAAINFNNRAEWVAQQDKFGFTSIAKQSGSSNERTRVELGLGPSHRQAVESALKALSVISTDDSAIGMAIGLTNDELLNGAQARPVGTATKAEILLSDGNNTGTIDPIQMANEAKASGILIFTVAFGLDANTVMLQQVADITGGKFYNAEDENSLQAVMDLISSQIILNGSAGTNNQLFNVTFHVGLPEGANVVDLGGGTFVQGADSNYIYYYIGYLDLATSWNGSYSLVFPCNDSHSCDTNSKVFPDSNSLVYYDDEFGVPQPPVLFDKNVIVNFLYRDLAINFFGGKIVSGNAIQLDVNAKNIGYLDSSPTTIDFYLNNPVNGTFLRQDPVSAFCGGKNLSCSNYFGLFNGLAVNGLGNIYAIINRNGAVRECPGNNIAQIYCSGFSTTQYYIMDLWMWRK